MSRCPRCSRSWPPEFRRCPQDGDVLELARPGGEMEGSELAIALAPDLEDPPPGTMIGEYRIEHKLGEGGMASVFAAIHPVIGKRAAIKIISRKLCSDRHAVERFIQEARTVNQIGHPNIVDIFAFGVLPQDRRCYLVMEWLQGESLSQRLAKERLAPAVAIGILLQICDALEAAHAKRIIHRDLKPDNVYLASTSGPPLAKLLDFGIAKLADSDATVPRTRSGAAIGTAGYMSPEQARGRAVDISTDIYALGVMAFEMILGRLPFWADNAVDILAQHLTEPPPTPRSFWPEIPAALNDLLLQMLEKESAKRPLLTEVRAVLSRLNRWEHPEPRAPQPTLPASGAALKRFYTSSAGVAGAAIACVVGILFFVPKRREPSVPVPSPMVQRPALLPVAPPAPTNTATIVLITQVGSARIVVDGRAIPSTRGTAQWADRPGEHRITVSAPRYLTAERVVVASAGTTTSLRIDLVRDRGPMRTEPRSKVDRNPADYTLDPFE